MTYLAIPYSFDPDISYEIVSKVAAELINRGEVIYSPINMFHHLSSKVRANQTDSDFWLKQCLPAMKACKKLMVIIPFDQRIGIQAQTLIKQSQGVQAEIKEAEKLGIPIEYYPS